MFRYPALWILALTCAAAACQPSTETPPAAEVPEAPDASSELLQKYATVTLTTDTSLLSESEREMIPHLVRAAQAMESAYWQQAYGDRNELLDSLDDPSMRRFAEINYGPWDRLADNEPFVPGVGDKPPGAGFYPDDVDREELDDPALQGQYTMVRRDDSGALTAIPYSVFFETSYGDAARELRAAAELAEDPGLKRYLELRADALLTDDYRASDMAWMDMKDNTLDIVIGPIENYEDQLFGYKTANEAFVLVKDREWSARLSRYAALLPELQRALPVDEAYKSETPGSTPTSTPMT